MRGIIAALAAIGVLVAGPSALAALDYDFDYSKLGVHGKPIERFGDFPGLPSDPFAQERFARFVGDLAMAIAPNPATPMYTIGDAAFELSLTTDVALISPKQVFSDGKERTVWPTVGAAPSALVLPTLNLRKGLPFSFEAGTSFSYLAGSSMMAASFDLKWALLEGLQWWPSIGVRAFGTLLVNSGELMMGLGGWDVGADYRIPIGGSLELILLGGYQRMGVAAATSNIDMVPEHEDLNQPSRDDRTFDELSFGNVFDPTTQIQRYYFGLQFKHRALLVGANAVYGHANFPISSGSEVKAEHKAWRLSAKLGVVF